MPIACLYFPRLGLQLALQQRTAPAGRPLALLSGHGDGALVAQPSREASAAGVIAGMLAGQARSICRDLAFLPDNPGACLDALDRIASILRKRAGGDVAVGGRDYLLAALAPSAPDTEARRLLDMAIAWTGLDGRVGIGDTIDIAVAAARSRRPSPISRGATGASNVESLPRYEPVVAEIRSARALGHLGLRAAIRRSIAGLGAILEARDESFRTLRMTLEDAGGVRELRLRPGAAFHHPREVEGPLFRWLDEHSAEAFRIRLELEEIGPSVRVLPCAASWAWDASGSPRLKQAS